MTHGSNHLRGVAMDLKAPTGTPEERAEQLARYSAFAVTMTGKLPPKVSVHVPGYSPYRLDVEPARQPRVLWGGRGLWGWLLGTPYPVQVGSPWDLELARRERERAAYRRKLWSLAFRQHGHHLHVAIKNDDAAVRQEGAGHGEDGR